MSTTAELIISIKKINVDEIYGTSYGPVAIWDWEIPNTDWDISKEYKLIGNKFSKPELFL